MIYALILLYLFSGLSLAYVESWQGDSTYQDCLVVTLLWPIAILWFLAQDAYRFFRYRR